MTTEMLRDLRILPMAAVVMPLPTELTTPPVTNIYLVPIYPPSAGPPQPDNHDTGRAGTSVKGTRREERRKRENPLSDPVWKTGRPGTGAKRPAAVTVPAAADILDSTRFLRTEEP